MPRKLTVRVGLDSLELQLLGFNLFQFKLIQLPNLSILQTCPSSKATATQLPRLCFQAYSTNPVNFQAFLSSKATNLPCFSFRAYPSMLGISILPRQKPKRREKVLDYSAFRPQCLHFNRFSGVMRP
jgi:hypothetical protein